MNHNFNNKFKVKDLLLSEYQYWNVSVRPKQPTIGSLVISLKRECHLLGAISSEESMELSTVFNNTEALLKNAFQFDKINYLCLMMVDNQVHFHVIPRYKNPVRFENALYPDICWPGPVDLSKIIEVADVDLKVLKHLQNYLVNKKLTIGYTTGVYDLFHIGHLNILKKAKAECDYLIVGVTTDELSLKRKNKIPVIPFHERVEIIKSLSCVDEVVSQDTMDKYVAWQKHKFHKMFVGSDWKGTDKWNQLEEDFAKVGVEIVYFPYTENTSSTMLKDVLTKML